MPLSPADTPYLFELYALTEIAKAQEEARPNRTDIDTYSRFGSLTEYDLSGGQVPMLGSKKVSFDAIMHELIWMLKGDRSLKYLIDNGVKLWNNWLVPGTEVYQAGVLVDAVVSALYPTAWRKWEKITCMPKDELSAFVHQHGLFIKKLAENGDDMYVHEEIDQVQWIIDTLNDNPMSRRILLSAWDPGQNHRVTLPACHPFVQFYVEQDGSLTSMLYMRSSDHFLGKPFNLVQYAVMTHLFAHLSGRVANRMLTIIGDQHLYANHLSVAEQQLSGALSMQSSHPNYQHPRITISKDLTNINDLSSDSVKLEDYIPGPIYKGAVAV